MPAINSQLLRSLETNQQAAIANSQRAASEEMVIKQPIEAETLCSRGNTGHRRGGSRCYPHGVALAPNRSSRKLVLCRNRLKPGLHTRRLLGKVLRDGFAAGMDVEFAVNAFDVHADGVDADREDVGDFFVGNALGEAVKNFLFPS